MKIAILIARILLGLMFLVFGANILFPFLPMPAQPPSDATTYMTILATHKYMAFVGLIQVIGGLLLLVGRYVPLGLTLLAPIIVNVWLFHVLLAGGHGLAPGFLAAVLELFLIYTYRFNFRGLFAAAPEVS